MKYDLIVVGAGAGGCYAAIRLAEFHPNVKICILEAARHPLSKVEISGGGRCNVTHACFDPEVLSTYYPRGGKEMLEPFKRFQPADLIEWFEKRKIKLKIEEDGRMFPVTDSSKTIVDCFLNEIKKNRIELLTSIRAVSWIFDGAEWTVKLFDGRTIFSKHILIASGSDQRTWDALKQSGHQLISPVPSLFTFNILDKSLRELMGISKTFVHLTIPVFKLNSSGPLLITHWGLSGPAILKLSAWGARELYRCGYVFDLHVNWLAMSDAGLFPDYMRSLLQENPKKQIINLTVKDFPTRLWRYLCARAEIPEFMSGAEFGKKQMKRMQDVLLSDTYRVTGKSTYKDEFVTAGGVELADVDMTTFESKKQSNLFLAGEVLNIDALTGGYNFQAAWTGGFIAAEAIAEKI